MEMPRLELDAGQAFVLARRTVPVVPPVAVVAFFPRGTAIGCGKAARVSVLRIPITPTSALNEDRGFMQETDGGEGTAPLMVRRRAAVVDEA